MRAVSLVCVLLFLLTSSFRRAVGGDKAKDPAAVIAKQHAHAQATWKKVFSDSAPAYQDSPRFLLYGQLAGKKLSEAAPLLERARTLAVKTLQLEGEAWPGKMAVFFVDDRMQYSSFVRTVQRRRAEPGESASFVIEGTEPYVVSAASSSKVDLGPELSAAEQVAAALMAKKNNKTPEWVTRAFGRATAVRVAAAKEQAAEHRRANAFLTQKKRTLSEVLGGGLEEDEAVVLRASLLEYLAYSGRTAKFLPLVKGFQTDEDMKDATFDAALKSVNLAADSLNTVWQNWVKTLK